MKTKAIWKNHRFVRLFSAASISIIGDYFDMLAISVLLAYTWKLDPMTIAYVPLMYALPGVLFGTYAGVLSDRLPRRKLMIASDVLSGLITFGFLFADSIYLLFPLIFIRSTIALVILPSQQSLVRSIVQKEQLLQASSLIAMINQAGKIAGPLIGATILAVSSPQICMIINAISSLISAIILLTLREIDELESQDETDTNETGLLAGWKYVLSQKILLFSFIFISFGVFTVHLIDTQFPILFREMLPTKPERLGWMLAASGLGAFIGMAILNRRKQLNYGWAFGGSLLLIAISFIGFGLWRNEENLLLPVALGLITGLGNGIFIVAFNYLLQIETAKHHIGKVYGMQNALFCLILITAPPLGGLLVKSMGVQPVFLLSGLFTSIVACIGIGFQKYIWTIHMRKDEIENQLEQVNEG
ncbi:MFS transporter [Bacillus solimangrovi]|uniref:MFS transporter n=1 Tax=Bacillus solimangrovi TaxID=1305675 RepID=A0A1E5LDC6_9BACI|nr:MFS transporter [Bacillus solimangrovi]OEH92072.1 hypothetical protein BFG57_17020 [Bacillus solimangrovi]